MSGVVAVVVNWNGREDTLACLAALGQSTPPPEHTILVDNGSTDGSGAAVRAAFPAVEVITLPENRHFAAGANAGMRHALEAGAHFIWLLNNDTTVTPGALAELRRVMESDDRIGIVGARLVHPGTPPRVVVGAKCDFHTGAIVEPLPPDDPALDRLVVDYVWGCAVLLHAGMLCQIGLFDEGFVAYFEDADLCLRARRAGWQTVGALRAVVHHHGSKTANRLFLQQMVLRGRNWVRCYMRHAPVGERRCLRRWLLGVRLPHLVWCTLVTITARTLRPRGRPIRLWSAR